MQRDITQKEHLESILAEWHHWAKNFRAIATCGADPMFRNARTSKQWDTTDDIIDSEITSKIMKAVNFQANELVEPYRTAIHVLARNCYTGRSVWFSPRLPTDNIERGQIIAEARAQLVKRLVSAGVM